MDSTNLIQDSFLKLGAKNQLFGVLTSTKEKTIGNKPTVIILNSGLIHRVGPNSIFTKLAKTLAINGFNVYRFDAEGIGDSISNNSKVKETSKNINNISNVMDGLVSKLGSESFIVFGHCSGAELAFQIAEKDKRVKGIIMVNGVGLPSKLVDEIYPIAEKSIQNRYYHKSSKNLNKWKKVFTGKSNAFSFDIILRFIQNSFAKAEKSIQVDSNSINETLDIYKSLNYNNVFVKFILSEGSSAFDLMKLTYLRELKTMDHVDFKLFENVDHTFTPVWSQELLIQEVNNWVVDKFNSK